MRSGPQTTAEREEIDVITERHLTITNKVGLHARPAALFVQTAARFKDTRVEVVKDGVQIAIVSMRATRPCDP